MGKAKILNIMSDTNVYVSVKHASIFYHNIKRRKYVFYTI